MIDVYLRYTDNASTLIKRIKDKIPYSVSKNKIPSVFKSIKEIYFEGFDCKVDYHPAQYVDGSWIQAGYWYGDSYIDESHYEQILVQEEKVNVAKTEKFGYDGIQMWIQHF
ncbi:MAG: hypothetical protein IPJ82_00015 [Lewinellaceae bacterium]|nr:hypothetical protein [Lewinellaceae bacterium]